MVVSCIKPTGDIHLGNYFGAIRNWVDLQDEFPCVFGIVDLHAMTQTYDPKQLKTLTNQMVIDLLTCGIDPAKSILFVQSLVPEHTHLSWMLNCLVPYEVLTKQWRFKEKIEKNNIAESSLGLFSYPILQAADILIYKGSKVPVGKDQAGHMELVQSIAQTFNDRYGDLFPIPEAHYSDTAHILSLNDPTQKMSKSHGEANYIRLFETDERLEAKIQAMHFSEEELKEEVISPHLSNIFEMVSACEQSLTLVSLMNDFQAQQLTEAKIKEALIDSIKSFIHPFIERRKVLSEDMSLINDTIRDLSAQAQKRAQETLYEVSERMGTKSVSNF